MQERVKPTIGKKRNMFLLVLSVAPRQYSKKVLISSDVKREFLCTSVTDTDNANSSILTLFT